MKFLLSGEFLFAAFLLANVYKSALPNLIVDLNILFFIWTVLIAAKRLFKKPHINKRFILPILLFVFFLVVCSLSLTYTTSAVYSVEKLLLLLSFTLWSFIGMFFLITNKESLYKFLLSFMIISIAISFYVLFDYFTSSNMGSFSRYGIDGSNSLGLGRSASLGSIIIIMLYVFNSKITKTKKLLAFFCLACSTLVLFLTGSRMALISLGAVIVVMMALKTFKFTKSDVLLNKGSLRVALSIVPIPIIMMFFQNYIQTMITRLSFLFNDTGVGSISLRTERFTVATDMWKNKPIFGNGLGSYPISYSGIDARNYPHNILLEILAELGILGFVTLVIIIVLPFFMHRIVKGNYMQICVLLLFIFTFLNANTSGDINDNRMMFAFLALLYTYPMFNTELEQKT